MTITNVKTGVLGVDDVYKKTLSEYYSYSAEDPLVPFTGGALYITGNNGSGSGLNDTIHRSSPVQIPGTWCRANGNLQYYHGIKTNGTLWAWGRNDDGWLGTGDTATRSSPIQIPGTTWCNVFYNGGSTDSGALKTDGTLWVWSCTCGDNSNIIRSSPVQIPGTTWCHLALGGSANLGFKTDNSMYVWGNSSNYGYLGLGQKLGRLSSPVQLPGLWCTGTSFGSGSFAIKTDGTLWAWGFNASSGNFGTNNVSTYSSSPVQVPGTTWCKVSAAAIRTFALKTDNTLWSWGDNTAGRLGRNSLDSNSSPIQIPGTTWNDVTSATYGAMAKKTNGSLWVWGTNTGGYSLGTGTGLPNSSPVQIPGVWACGVFGYSNSAYIRNS